MRDWLIILGGLVVWAAHFLAIYAIASIFPGQAVARWLVLAATIGAIAANALIFWRLARPSNGDGFKHWVCDLGRTAVALSVLAVIWQSAPLIWA